MTLIDDFNLDFSTYCFLTYDLTFLIIMSFVYFLLPSLPSSAKLYKRYRRNPVFLCFSYACLLNT